MILEAMGRHQRNVNEGLTKQIHWEKWAACRHTKEAERDTDWQQLGQSWNRVPPAGCPPGTSGGELVWR